ncbi:hypothetical protein ABB37_06089 [Leptomonas pyrrhocoris]|uniref:Uncharacterized protein n=1 Tax=Leptomonas pyrrhocoris TaxID=157538 RepID=A0A0M9FY38_LEPPY|nr:hypothetical protein ABB37_06089 [Leptomonas pyrrhocoris]XP_015656905.1 hypothetical protein ABB37_06089 [Leptomonas pyrrhocoris]KPA78465.1 hypothetical protein ABB37_06089 [Leptomonas pyrrhocoris]KPA78466.1 hypothetical protein ABB37_06089 [Leptomonas pyrrhocoris]|eukprot:XP_015656904.1 hypothetical protein ABB37_06089 [Leptomonas pyrrhocoris]
MASLRSFVVYFADRHTAALAAVFAFFTAIVFYCGGLGMTEVELRQAAAVFADTAAFAPVPLARITAVAFVALTEADIVVLNGGPLPSSPYTSSSLHAGWTAERGMAMARRWHQHYAVGDITVVSVPAAFTSHPVVRHWFAYLESHCTDCHFVPLMSSAAAEGVNSTLHGRPSSSAFSFYPFCSSAAIESGSESLPTTTKHAAAVSAETPLGARGLDLLVWDAVPERGGGGGSMMPPDMPFGCGVVVLLTPNALRRYVKGLQGNRSGASATTTNTSGGTSDFEGLLAHAATEVDPPLDSPTAAAASPLDLAERSIKAERFYAALGGALATQVSTRLGYRPQYVLYAAWCASARSYGFRTSSPSSLLNGQSMLYVLCLRESEIVEVTATLRRFVRISEASVL